jgi:hypothetical protein
MKDYSNAILHCYRQLFANANPPANFDKLMEEATVNDHGQKEIPFMDHEIDEELMDSIITDTMKVYKIKDKTIQQRFKTTIYLGCSPKSKRKC